MAGPNSNINRKIRWKLALGQVDEPADQQLSLQERQTDQALDRLYSSDRQGGLATKRVISAKWMAEIKSLFPTPIVRVMQKDALEKFGIRKLLNQPDFLEEIEPDVGMIATILSAKESLSPIALLTAKQLVARLSRQVQQKLRFKLISRIHGVRDHRFKLKNPRLGEIDWHLTIKSNLKHFQPSLQTIIPETIIGRPHRKNQAKKLILLVDQSASMAESYVYAGILGSIMATIDSLKTHLIVFDTEVVDLTEYLSDPVELLFKGQLGGGTNIYKALKYALNLVFAESRETYIILISDLFEGGPISLFLDAARELISHKVQLFSLLALDDLGVPAYDKEVAKPLAEMGIPCFGCTPDLFPDVMAAALNGDDLTRFASSR
ncbi:MAG: VWA domain-containing protein [Saprospiraceae bacterium]|nr:VWA domain-containing protein [Saprospiraceae bacterium]